jgi:hypothetical protein
MSYQFGDLTGARHQARIQERADREDVIQQTLAEIRSGDDIVIVAIPGGRSFAVPRQIVRYLGAEK